MKESCLGSAGFRPSGGLRLLPQLAGVLLDLADALELLLPTTSSNAGHTMLLGRLDGPVPPMKAVTSSTGSFICPASCSRLLFRPEPWRLIPVSGFAQL